MKIQILGTGCSKCKYLFEAAEQAVKKAACPPRSSNLTLGDHGDGVLLDPEPADLRDAESSRPNRWEMIEWRTDRE